jgi:predicted Rossmann fold flavoprotein
MSFSKMQSSWDVIIIGGGAAGLWAAGTAALRGRRVLVLEKNNKAGVKILMSGGTRCNITHNCDTRKIAEAFGKHGKVLLSPLSKLSPQDVIKELNHLGVETKVEETGKIFPSSDRAIDVRDAIVKRLQQAGAQLWTGSPVTHVRPLPESGFGVTANFGSTTSELTCQSVLITSGGLSFSGCGTTGDGYPWAQSFGHTVTPLRPALTPLLSHTPWVHELSGLTLDDVNVTTKLHGANAPNKVERSSARGGLLWTHFGLSGPTAMNVSRCVSDLSAEQSSSVVVDLVPNQSREECEAWLSREIRSSQKSITNILSQLIPRRLSQSLMQQLGLKEDQHGAEFSNKSKNQLLESLKNLSIPIHGTRGYAKAEVTAGGVALGEVNFQDMQSRKHPGLYFAGEILDLDGPIGGFNFQAAWSTGHAAGLHV